MESSGGNYHHPGAQDEPFFDLLQPSAPITAPKTGYTNSSAYNVPKKMENSTDFNFGGDDVLPSFDFQQIRTTPASSSSANASGGSSSTAVRIEEGRQGSPPTSYTSYEPMVRRSREPPPTYETPVSRTQEHEKESFDSATAAAVERIMKKYADNLLRVLEGMTGRLSQLESSTQRLEHLFEEIKNVVGDTHVDTDGKLRSLESHILEVQRGVQVLRDRQEIFEAQSQLAKLQTAKAESASLHSAPSAPPPPPPPPPVPESESQLVRASSGKALMEAPQRQVSDSPSSSYYQPQPQLQLQQMPSLPAPTSQQPQPPPQQPLPQQQHTLQHQHQQHHLQPQLQLQQPMQLQQPGVLQNEVSHQTMQQQQPPPPPPPPPPPQQLSQPLQLQTPHPHPPPPYSQQQQQQQQQQPPYTQQPQPAPQPPPMPNYSHPPELPAYGQHPHGPHPGSHHVPMPPSSYPPDLPSYHPSYGPPRSGLPPQQQPPPNPQPQQPQNVGMYESPMGRGGSGQLSLPAPPYLPPGHGGPQYEAQGMSPGSGYPSSSYRVAQPVPSAPSGGSSGSGGYPRLPVAQPLPHALPTRGGGPEPPSSGNPSLSTNRVPIDEVIDKVTAMGFSKDQVRAVVRRLTENGQSVDLNIVLDKLMNGDSSQAPQKGWFGR